MDVSRLVIVLGMRFLTWQKKSGVRDRCSVRPYDVAIHKLATSDQLDKQAPWRLP